MVVEHLVDRDRLGLALDDDVIDLARPVDTLEAGERVLADENARAVLLAGALEARREVDAVTDHGEVHALRAPDVPRDDHVGVDPDADVDRLLAF